MKDAPAFDFYPERWLVGVASFSDSEQLSYLRLLCHQWLMQGLPDDKTALRRLAGKGVTAAIIAKFPVCEDGLRRNRRLENIRVEQRERIAKKSEQRKAAAMRRWHPEECGSDAAALREDMREDMRKPCERNAHHPPPTTHPVPVSVSLSPSDTPRGGNRPPERPRDLPLADGSGAADAAERIVRAYPANGDRRAAEAAVAEAIAAGEDPVAILRQVQAHAVRMSALHPGNRRFCPGLAAYFAGGRWRDDPAAHPWTVVTAPVETREDGRKVSAAEALRKAAATVTRAPRLVVVPDSERVSPADFKGVKEALG